MFRKLNLYLFAGFVLALKSSIMIALIYGLGLACLTPFTGGEFVVTIIPYVMGLVALITFFTTITAFFLVMTAKVWGARFNKNNEGYWVYSIAALSTNLWFMTNYDRNFIGLYILNLVISVMAILLGNRIYQKTMLKLESLIA